jgi:hypothetical protein
MGKPPPANAAPGIPAAASPPTGCCIITYPDGSGEQWEHITAAECQQKGATLGGAVEWVPGDCP